MSINLQTHPTRRSSKKEGTSLGLSLVPQGPLFMPRLKGS